MEQHRLVQNLEAVSAHLDPRSVHQNQAGSPPADEEAEHQALEDLRAEDLKAEDPEPEAAQSVDWAAVGLSEADQPDREVTETGLVAVGPSTGCRAVGPFRDSADPARLRAEAGEALVGREKNRHQEVERQKDDLAVVEGEVQIRPLAVSPSAAAG